MSWNQFFEHFELALQEAESKFKTGEGADKRTFVIAITNEFFDLPFTPEGIEAVIIGWMIDLVIYILNKWFGKDWLNVLKDRNKSSTPKAVE